MNILRFLSNLIIITCVFHFLSCNKTQPLPITTLSSVPIKENLIDKFSYQDSLVVDGYLDSIAYSQGDSAILYVNSKKVQLKSMLSLKDINGTPIDSIKCDALYPQKPLGDSITKNGYNYNYKMKFKISEALKSGIYLISDKIPFLVKSRYIKSDILVVYPTNTINAYNSAGNFSLYSINNVTNKYYGEVSFKRPSYIDEFSIGFLKLYANSNFDYISDFELDNFELIKNYKVIIIIGHNEYWTRQAKFNFDLYIDNGGNSLILSGNTCWWQVRYSDDKTKLICFKDFDVDPNANPKLKSILWTDPRLQSSILSSIGADFDHGGYGTQTDKGWDGYKIIAEKSPLLEGTNLKKGEIISNPTHEYDGSPVIFNSNSIYPQIDNTQLKFNKLELVAYDYGYRFGNTVSTFIVFKKKPTSGYIINVSSTNWCSLTGIGGKNSKEIKTITDNSIHILSSMISPFSL